MILVANLLAWLLALCLVLLAVLLVMYTLVALWERYRPRFTYCACSRCVLLQADHMDIEGTRHTYARCSPLVESLS